MNADVDYRFSWGLPEDIIQLTVITINDEMLEILVEVEDYFANSEGEPNKLAYELTISSKNKELIKKLQEQDGSYLLIDYGYDYNLVMTDDSNKKLEDFVRNLLVYDTENWMIHRNA